MIYFREVQRLWVWLILLLPLAVPIIIVTRALQHIQTGHPIPHGVLYVMYGPLALIVILFSLGRLVTEVRETGLFISFFPLWPERTIRWDEIRRAESISYAPSPYGGWGVRMRFGRMAYTVSGNRGVRIELKDGEEVLVGSQRPDELAQAISERIGPPNDL